MRQKPKPKAVFFDLFHTLYSYQYTPGSGMKTCEYLGVTHEDWNQVLFDQSDDRFRGKITDKYEIVRNLVSKIRPGVSESQIRNAADIRDKRFYEGLSKLNEPNASMIRKLKSQGLKVGLISNADAVEVRGWFASPISKLFEAAVFSYQVGYFKPEKEIYLHAMKTLGVNPEESVFVGDGSCNELHGAREVGMKTILTTGIIQHMWPEKIPARRANADAVIDDLAKLPELLSSW